MPKSSKSGGSSRGGSSRGGGSGGGRGRRRGRPKKTKKDAPASKTKDKNQTKSKSKSKSKDTRPPASRRDTFGAEEFGKCRVDSLDESTPETTEIPIDDDDSYVFI